MFSLYLRMIIVGKDFQSHVVPHEGLVFDYAQALGLDADAVSILSFEIEIALKHLLCAENRKR